MSYECSEKNCIYYFDGYCELNMRKLHNKKGICMAFIDKNSKPAGVG